MYFDLHWLGELLEGVLQWLEGTMQCYDLLRAETFELFLVLPKAWSRLMNPLVTIEIGTTPTYNLTYFHQWTTRECWKHSELYRYSMICCHTSILAIVYPVQSACVEDHLIQSSPLRTTIIYVYIYIYTSAMY